MNNTQTKLTDEQATSAMKIIGQVVKEKCPKGIDQADAKQELITILIENAHNFDATRSSWSTFVGTIARRRLIDQIRKSNRQKAKINDGQTPVEEVVMRSEKPSSRHSLTDWIGGVYMIAKKRFRDGRIPAFGRRKRQGWCILNRARAFTISAWAYKTGSSVRATHLRMAQPDMLKLLELRKSMSRDSIHRAVKVMRFAVVKMFEEEARKSTPEK